MSLTNMDLFPWLVDIDTLLLAGVEDLEQFSADSLCHHGLET
jgi:hypothetical protein